jgi:hypothetical protein
MIATKISRRKFLKLLGSGITILALYLLGYPRLKDVLADHRPTHDDSLTFQVGANNPSFDDNYGIDLGYNQFLGEKLWHWPHTEPVPIDLSKPDPNPRIPYLSEHPKEIEDLFKKAKGLDVVRIWLFEHLEGLIFDGNKNNELIGIDADFMHNLNKILATAQKYNVKVYLALFDGNNSAYNPSPTLPPDRLPNYYAWRDAMRNILRSIVKNPEYFSNMVLFPIIEGIKDQPALYAIDLINEPEFMMEGPDAIISEAEMVNFIDKCTMAIKRLSLDKLNVTIGCANIETAKRYSALPIDFADVHIYQTIGEEIEAYVADDYNNKQCLIGECGHDEWDIDKDVIRANQLAVTKKIVRDAKDKGYMGALPWGVFHGDSVSEEDKEEILDWLKDFDRT